MWNSRWGLSRRRTALKCQNPAGCPCSWVLNWVRSAVAGFRAPSAAAAALDMDFHDMFTGGCGPEAAFGGSCRSAAADKSNRTLLRCSTSRLFPLHGVANLLQTCRLPPSQGICCVHTKRCDASVQTSRRRLPAALGAIPGPTGLHQPAGEGPCKRVCSTLALACLHHDFRAPCLEHMRTRWWPSVSMFDTHC
jgi:hypothetical protein